MDFFGMSSRKTGVPELDAKGEVQRTKRGDVIMVTEHARWTSCSFCGNFFGHDENGSIIDTRKGFTKSEVDALFPTTRENDRAS